MFPGVVLSRTFFRLFQLSLFVGSALLLVQLPVLASQDVTLTWNPSADSSVVGYKLYFGVESGNYTTWVDVGNVTQAKVALPDGSSTFYFAATAYDELGNESDYSEETIAYPSQSVADGSLEAITQAKVTDGVFGFMVNGASGTVYVVEASTNLVNWVAIATNAVPFAFSDPDSARYAQRFYRSRPLSEVQAVTVATPSLTQAGQVGGMFSFTVNGVAGNQYVVEASADLLNWAPIATNAAPFVFADPDSSRFSQRFYRSRPL